MPQQYEQLETAKTEKAELMETIAKLQKLLDKERVLKKRALMTAKQIPAEQNGNGAAKEDETEKIARLQTALAHANAATAAAQAQAAIANQAQMAQQLQATTASTGFSFAPSSKSPLTFKALQCPQVCESETPALNMVNNGHCQINTHHPT